VYLANVFLGVAMGSSSSSYFCVPFSSTTISPLMLNYGLTLQSNHPSGPPSNLMRCLPCQSILHTLVINSTSHRQDLG